MYVCSSNVYEDVGQMILCMDAKNLDYQYRWFVVYIELWWPKHRYQEKYWEVAEIEKPKNAKGIKTNTIT